MTNFNFDPDVSPGDNIKLFFEHLREREPNLAALLERNIEKLIPLPSGVPRREARKSVNEAIRDALSHDQADPS